MWSFSSWGKFYLVNSWTDTLWFRSFWRFRAHYWLLCFPFWQSYFIKLFNARLQCEFIRTFFLSTFANSFSFQSTSMRESALYVKYYSLIGSLIVMVLIPIIILITACVYLRSAIPDGQHKEKISRIMIIIICMFIVAHVPKVKP